MSSHIPFRISLSRSFSFGGGLPPGGLSSVSVYPLTSVHIYFQAHFQAHQRQQVSLRPRLLRPRRRPVRGVRRRHLQGGVRRRCVRGLRRQRVRPRGRGSLRRLPRKLVVTA